MKKQLLSKLFYPLYSPPLMWKTCPVVQLASSLAKQTKIGAISVNQILRRENFARGVVVRQQDNGVAVDVNIIVGYGTKISEVSKSVQAKVKYNLETMLGITANSVNVCVQGVRTLED